MVFVHSVFLFAFADFTRTFRDDTSGEATGVLDDTIVSYQCIWWGSLCAYSAHSRAIWHETSKLGVSQMLNAMIKTVLLSGLCIMLYVDELVKPLTLAQELERYGILGLHLCIT